MKRQKSSNNDWLKPRGYVHFTSNHKKRDSVLNKYLTSYVSTTESVAQHPFHPLIHRTIVARRFKEIKEKDIHGNKGYKAHNYINSEGKKISNAKEREIFYSTHIDAVIYAYYTQKILSPKYEDLLKTIPNLKDCVSSYRKIPTNIEGVNKNNIHFAHDVFTFIKEHGECSALAFDVSKFFDSLNHEYLKIQWNKLLDTSKLPDDHYNIFKSLTNFSFVEFKDVLKEFGIKNASKLMSMELQSFCESPEEFRTRIKDNKLIKTHPFKNSKNEPMGIPQGTPISAFLSNLYMFSFDSYCFKLSQSLNGLYRRYSDDIIIVCPSNMVEDVKEKVVKAITDECSLVINPDKIGQSNFYFQKDKLICDKPLQYLGFEFNGQRTIIRPSSLAKFYRKLKNAVRSDARQAYHSRKKKSEKGLISEHSRLRKSSLFKRYSHLGRKSNARNFIVYALSASKIMNEPAIKKQISRAWDILNSEIKKNESKYEL